MGHVGNGGLGVDQGYVVDLATRVTQFDAQAFENQIALQPR